MQLTKPKKIFIVDPDKAFNSSLKTFLVNKANHDVHTFDNCAEALNAFSDKPDIILLNNHLNLEQRDKESNMQLLDIIKKDYPDMHVVILATDEGYGTAMQTILHGAEQYVIKDRNVLTTLETMVAEL